MALRPDGEDEEMMDNRAIVPRAAYLYMCVVDTLAWWPPRASFRGLRSRTRTDDLDDLAAFSFVILMLRLPSLSGRMAGPHKPLSRSFPVAKFLTVKMSILY